MAAIRSFRALRAVPDTASRVASPPYDVMDVDEARELARGEPLSFLRVSRAELELPSETDPYADAVYVRAAENFRKIRVAAPFVTEAKPSLYCYRLQTTGHEQTGLTACYSLDEYDRGLIKRHEHTRWDKKADRTRHLTELGAQTGLVLLTYRATAEIDALTESACVGTPLFDFEAPDNVQHTVWRVPPADVDPLVKAFEAVSALYIADGHHRMASASLAREEFVRQGRPTVPSEADAVMATAFPHTQVRILPYNRVVQDLQGRSPREFLKDALDVWDEPHVQHAISLIEYKGLDGAEFHIPLLHQVEQPAWSRDHNVDAVVHRALLWELANTTEDHGVRNL